jgi:hypothetical protein
MTTKKRKTVAKKTTMTREKLVQLHSWGLRSSTIPPMPQMTMNQLLTMKVRNIFSLPLDLSLFYFSLLPSIQMTMRATKMMTSSTTMAMMTKKMMKMMKMHPQVKNNGQNKLTGGTVNNRMGMKLHIALDRNAYSTWPEISVPNVNKITILQL